MKRKRLIAAAAFVLACAGAASVRADAVTLLGPLAIERPWARASAAANGAAYMVISNQGKETDALIGASSPVAQTVELHTVIMDGDVMRMRPVKAIEVNVSEPAVLKPGGLHIMLMGLKAPLKQAETFPLTLTFANAGTVTVTVAIEGPGAGEPGGHPHHDH
jgi:hypothetical protein